MKNILLILILSLSSSIFAAQPQSWDHAISLTNHGDTAIYVEAHSSSIFACDSKNIRPDETAQLSCEEGIQYFLMQNNSWLVLLSTPALEPFAYSSYTPDRLNGSYNIGIGYHGLRPYASAE